VEHENGFPGQPKAAVAGQPGELVNVKSNWEDKTEGFHTGSSTTLEMRCMGGKRDRGGARSTARRSLRGHSLFM